MRGARTALLVIFGFAVFGLSFAALPALAKTAAPVPYEEQAFREAQADGGLILVESYASWCLPCRIQEPIIRRLRKEPAYSRMIVFRVGEDSAQAAWKKLRLFGYGEIVVFRGAEEVGRGTPIDEQGVRSLLAIGLR